MFRSASARPLDFLARATGCSASLAQVAFDRSQVRIVTSLARAKGLPEVTPRAGVLGHPVDRVYSDMDQHLANTTDMWMVRGLTEAIGINV